MKIIIYIVIMLKVMVYEGDNMKCPKCGSDRYYMKRKFTDIWYECPECGYDSRNETKD